MYHVPRQQAVEKCLKAFLVLHDIEPPRSHDLLYLKTKCQSMERLPEIDDTILSRLNPYAAKHRYPGEIDLDESEVVYQFPVLPFLTLSIIGRAIQRRGWEVHGWINLTGTIVPRKRCPDDGR